MRIFYLLYILVSCDASVEFELGPPDQGLHEMNTDAGVNVETDDMETVDEEPMAARELLYEMEIDHPGAREYFIEWANDESALDILGAISTSRIFPSYLPYNSRQYLVNESVVAEFLLFRNFDSTFDDVEECLRALRLDPRDERGIRIFPQEWRPAKIVDRMEQLRSFATVSKWFHEYWMNQESDPIDSSFALLGGARIAGDITNKERARIFTYKSKVWVEFCIGPLKRFGQRNFFFNERTNEFEMNHDTKARLYRSLTFQHFARLQAN